MNSHFRHKAAAIAIAALVAPLFATVGTALAFFARYPRDFMQLVDTRGWLHMLGPSPFVTGFAYAITIVIGVPVYLLLSRFGLAKPYMVVGAGVIIGAAFSVLMEGLDWQDGVLPGLVVSAVAVATARAVESRLSVKENGTSASSGGGPAAPTSI